MDLKETGCGMNSPTQDRDGWRAVVITAMNLWVHKWQGIGMRHYDKEQTIKRFVFWVKVTKRPTGDETFLRLYMTFITQRKTT
jgi:hypothetical protein